MKGSTFQAEESNPEVGEVLAYLRPVGLDHDEPRGNWDSQQGPDHSLLTRF